MRQPHIGFLRRCTLLTVLAIATPALAGGSDWVEFVDQTSTRLIADPGVGANDPDEVDYAWGDVDQDGDIDIVVMRKQTLTTTGRRVNILLINEGIADGRSVDGVFVDRTDEFVTQSTVAGDQGFNTPTNDRDVALADVNGDGWLDIITATTLSDGQPKHISHPRIYINLGEVGGVWQGFRFENDRFPLIAELPDGTAYAPRLCAVSAGDIDNDGDMDLYFTDYDQPSVPPPPFGVDVDDILLINDGSGNFTEETDSRFSGSITVVSQNFPFRNSAFGMANVIADMNNDGFNDIVKDSALLAPQYIGTAYNNPDNPGHFETYDAVYTSLPYHVNVAFLNDDEFPDIIVTDDGRDAYMISTGLNPDGTVNYATRQLLSDGGTDNNFGGNNLGADFDQDGNTDIYICDFDVDIDSGGRAHIYRNLGDGPIPTIRELHSARPWTPQDTHDAAIFDFSGDGFPDMVIGTRNATRVWVNVQPAAVNFDFPDGIPDSVLPDTATQIPVDLFAVNTAIVSASQFVSVNGEAFVETDLAELEDGFVVNLPEADCASFIQFYISITATGGAEFVSPPGAPTNTYSVLSAFGINTVLDERFEENTPEWTVDFEDLTAGDWQRVNPVGTQTGGNMAQPEDDAGDGADTMCYITQQHIGGGVGASDVDGGPTTLTSPVIDLSAGDAVISYARWHFSNPVGGGDIDSLVTEITSNGTDWVEVSSTMGTNSSWENHSFLASDFVDPTATVQVRFVVSDNPNNSLTESGIDNFSVNVILCEDTIQPFLPQAPPDTAFSTQAFSGYVDSRRESNNGDDHNLGLDRVTLVFSEPVTDIGSETLSMSAFSVDQTGGGAAPNITGIETEDNQSVTVIFDRIITLQEWTTVTANVEDLAGNPIVDDNSVSIAALPADVDQNGRVQPLDLLRMRQALTGAIADPEQGVLTDRFDIDRNGNIQALDLLRWRQLWTGAGSATQAWQGNQLNNDQP